MTTQHAADEPVFVTSDIHEGHINIIKYSGRPYPDVETMSEALVENWNTVVPVEATVYVLGDVAMGKLPGSLVAISRLNGRKVLVAGNHDRCWAGHGAKAARSISMYLEAGFAEVHQTGIALNIDGRHFEVSHFPYALAENDGRGARFERWQPIDRGSWLLHGHVHERWRQRGRMINVGVDAWNYRPVTIPQILDLVAAGPQDLDRLPPVG